MKAKSSEYSVTKYNSFYLRYLLKYPRKAAASGRNIIKKIKGI